MDALTAKLRSRTRRQIVHCSRCPLRASCHEPVPFSGPSPSSLVVIGEAPGADEDAEGRPFVGRSGQLLRAVLKNNGIDPDAIVIMNTVCCRPPGNRAPTVDEMTACRANYDAQVAVAKPEWILVLGATALSSVRSDLKISQVRGRPFVQSIARWPIPPAYERTPVYVPTYHPSAALRGKDQLRCLEDDVKLLASMMARPDYLELLPMACLKCGKDGVCSPADLLVYCDTHMPNWPMRSVPVPVGVRSNQLAIA